MKTILLLVLFLVSMNVWGVVGVPQTVCVDATTITDDFEDGAALIVAGLSGKNNTVGQNTSDETLEFCFNAITAAGCNVDWELPPVASYTFDNMKTGDFIRVRHKGSAPTSGTVCAGGW